MENGLHPNHVPIYLEKGNFAVSVKGKQKGISVNRQHFPIVPRFSCTAHKAQGMTLRTAIIDLVPNPNQKAIDISVPYVPLSRVRRLEDLTILRPFHPDLIKKVQPHPACKKMMAEFKKLDICKNI